MAKKDKKDEIKATYICDNCKYFDNVCTHPNNLHIYINKKIEKKTFKDTEKKVKCNNYVQSDIKF